MATTKGAKRAAKKHLLMLSAQGGVEIEAVAATDPDAIVMLHIDPVDGISLATARDAAVRAKIDSWASTGVTPIAVMSSTVGGQAVAIRQLFDLYR